MRSVFRMGLQIFLKYNLKSGRRLKDFWNFFRSSDGVFTFYIFRLTKK